MATGGGVVLDLRVPSASVAPARRCRTTASSSVRCGAAPARRAGGGLEEDHYRTLGLAPGATRGDVKKAFHRLALQYHPDVVRDGHQDRRRGLPADQRGVPEGDEQHAGGGARLEYWRRRYGLADEDLDRYRHYLNDDDEDDWFAGL